jgi:hypothetical protein
MTKIHGSTLIKMNLSYSELKVIDEALTFFGDAIWYQNDGDSSFVRNGDVKYDRVKRIRPKIQDGIRKLWIPEYELNKKEQS